MDTKATKAKPTTAQAEQSAAQALGLGALTITKRVVERIPLFTGVQPGVSVGQLVDQHLQELALNGGSPESIKVEISDELWTKEELRDFYKNVDGEQFRLPLVHEPLSAREQWEQ